MIRFACFICLISTTLVTGAPAQDAASRFVIPADGAMIGQGPVHREDWFQNLWRSQRERFAATKSEDQGAVTFLGDSITQGWDDRLSSEFPGMKVANRGISGDTTRGMLNRMDDDVLAIDPACLVMLMGTNDLELNATPEMIAANIHDMIEKAHQHDANMPIVMCLVMPSSEKMRRPATKIQAVNGLLAGIAKQYPQVFVLDTYTKFAEPSGDAPASLFPDLLHLNDAGYAAWATALRPVFATYGLVENEADSFQPEDGFKLIFNGNDLTGWGYRPADPDFAKQIEEWRKKDPTSPGMPAVETPVAFDGMTQSPDGRYVAKHGRLIVTAPVEGRLIQELSTTQQWPGDFELRLEFRASPMADSGIFIRKPQLQCRDYKTAGPYNELTKYEPQQWNEIVVIVKDNVAHATCNGEVLESAMKLPETGPIGLEGDRGQMEYRRIRIKRSD